MYADTFMFGGPNGVQAVKKDDFLKVIPKMKAHFSSRGLTPDGGNEPSIFQRSPRKGGVENEVSEFIRHKHVDAFTTYVLLRGQGDALSIVFQLDHQDLASVVKEWQNTQQ